LENAGILNAISNRVVAIGAIFTGIVALGSQLNSCTAQSVQRYASFRTSVAAEEGYWKGLLEENASLAGETNPKIKERKELLLISLGGHRVPTFREYRASVFDGSEEITIAQDRLNQMKSDLGRALGSSDDPRVAAAARLAFSFDVGQAQLAEKTDAGPTDAPPPAPTDIGDRTQLPSDVTPNPSTQIMVAGNPGGWDIDVFWCAGGSKAVELENYVIARNAAQLLAQQSVKGKLSASVFLGTVRLRPLPLMRQGGGYPGAGSNNTIRAEANDAEREAAAAVLGLLDRNKLGFTVSESLTPTRWYLSAFVCRADDATPGSVAAPQPPSGNRATGA
jgi:hypothetical protein